MKSFACYNQILLRNVLRDCICALCRACNFDHARRIFSSNGRRILIGQYLVFSRLFLLRCQSAKSRRCLDGDSEVNWRHGMFSNIVYAYIRKGVMLDRFDMTLLLNNEFLRKTSNESKSFKNNIFEVLSGRMLFERFIRCEND